MSRSFKKNPVCKEWNHHKKWMKRQANKKVRRTHELSGKSNIYRKAYESWDICDFRFFIRNDGNVEELNCLKNAMYRK